MVANSRNQSEVTELIQQAIETQKSMLDELMSLGQDRRDYDWENVIRSTVSQNEKSLGIAELLPGDGVSIGIGREGSGYTVLYNDGRALVGQKDKLIVDFAKVKSGFPSASNFSQYHNVKGGDEGVEFQTDREGTIKVLTLRYRKSKGIAKYWWQPSYETKVNKDYLYGYYDVYHPGRRSWSDSDYGL